MNRPARAPAQAVALLAAAHPLPALAVTGLTTALAAGTGRSATGCALVAVTIATGQLSVGWGNDLLDRDRDRHAQRTDKPLATGRVRVATVRWACAAALVACVPLSLANGWRPGLVHLVAVGCAWAYNLGLKRTAGSVLPYAVSFALLPAFLTLALPGSPWPHPWVTGAGALLGIGAHFLNVVPDVEIDRAQGVLGLPQRLGPTTAAVVGACCLAVAGGLAVLGPQGRTPLWAWVGLAGTVATAVAAAMAGASRRGGKATFRLGVATAAEAVLLLLARGGDLT